MSRARFGLRASVPAAAGPTPHVAAAAVAAAAATSVSAAGCDTLDTEEIASASTDAAAAVAAAAFASPFADSVGARGRSRDSMAACGVEEEVVVEVPSTTCPRWSSQAPSATLSSSADESGSGSVGEGAAAAPPLPSPLADARAAGVAVGKVAAPAGDVTAGGGGGLVPFFFNAGAVEADLARPFAALAGACACDV